MIIVKRGTLLNPVRNLLVDRSQLFTRRKKISIKFHGYIFWAMYNYGKKFPVKSEAYCGPLSCALLLHLHWLCMCFGNCSCVWNTEYDRRAEDTKPAVGNNNLLGIVYAAIFPVEMHSCCFTDASSVSRSLGKKSERSLKTRNNNDWEETFWKKKEERKCWHGCNIFPHFWIMEERNQWGK